MAPSGTYLVDHARNVLRTDEHGKSIVWQWGPYFIAVDDPADAGYVTLWKEGVRGKIGSLSLTPGRENETKGFHAISKVEILPKYRNLGLGRRMYQIAHQYLRDGSLGLASELPDRANKKQVPKIWRSLGAHETPAGTYLLRRESISDKADRMILRMLESTMPLNSLLSTTTPQDYANTWPECFRYIEKEHLRGFESDYWREFLASVKEHGIKRPIVIRHVDPKTNRRDPKVIEGHHRVWAAHRLGLPSIPYVDYDKPVSETSTYHTMKTWSQIREEQDPGGKKHDLKLVCDLCENSMTCRCMAEKREFHGICDECNAKIQEHGEVSHRAGLLLEKILAK